MIGILELFCAMNAERIGWIQFQAFDTDFLVTGDTDPEFTPFDFLQRLVDPREFKFATALRFAGHGLGLHGIHPRQTSDTGLIQFDYTRRLITGFADQFDGLPAFHEDGFKVF
jgi:hypothetical protein